MGLLKSILNPFLKARKNHHSNMAFIPRQSMNSTVFSMLFTISTGPVDNLWVSTSK